MNDVTKELHERQAKHSSGEPPVNEVDFGILDARRIDLQNEPPKPVPVISLAGEPICTPGNITVVAGAPKTAKSTVIGAQLAAAMPVDESAADTRDLLGFTGLPSGGKALVHFDTEQSPYDAWSLVRCAALRIGESTFPDNFRCYRLADVVILQRLQLVKAELKRAAQECGGIHCVFIDGIADLCIDLNDPVEAFGLVEELVQLATKYNCPIITVLHENPSGRETGKTRGHLGSQLQRKAESNLRVVKDAKGISTIYSEHCRRAWIPKDKGPRFAWDNEAGMHISVFTDDKNDRREEKRRDAQPAVDSAFAGAVGNIAWSDLKKRIMERCHVSDRTAERRIKDWLGLRLIVVNQGEYRRA